MATLTESPSNGQQEDFTSDLYAFLHALPNNILGRLYSSPASCLAIFRLLPLMARHLVLNVLWSEKPLARTDVDIWASKTRLLRKALFNLIGLHIIYDLTEANGENPEHYVILNPSFQENFKRALTGGGTHGSFGVPCEGSSDSSVGLERLDSYATEKWETILHYMVSSTLPTKPSHNVRTLLFHSGLMSAADPRAREMKISSLGFQFLLNAVNTQLWELLLQYLEMAEENGIDVVEVLACFFMLGSLELGREYSMENLSETQIRVLNDLVDYGLIYLSDSRKFYPTRLATTLTSTAPPIVSTDSDSKNQDVGFLVLETNYRVYAYTSNPLQIAVLNLFITLKYRFPNLVVGAITRESIKSALSNGITADQIILYLQTHAHPQTRKVEPLLPPTVVDQIRLWELEKNRVRDQEGFLYEDFRSTADYDLVIQYSKQLDIVLWENSVLRKFFVGPEGHSALREFIKRRMGGG